MMAEYMLRNWSWEKASPTAVIHNNDSCICCSLHTESLQVGRLQGLLQDFHRKCLELSHGSAISMQCDPQTQKCHFLTSENWTIPRSSICRLLIVDVNAFGQHEDDHCRYHKSGMEGAW